MAPGACSFNAMQGAARNQDPRPSEPRAAARLADRRDNMAFVTGLLAGRARRSGESAEVEQLDQGRAQDGQRRPGHAGPGLKPEVGDHARAADGAHSGFPGSPYPGTRIGDERHAGFAAVGLPELLAAHGGIGAEEQRVPKAAVVSGRPLRFQ